MAKPLVIVRLPSGDTHMTALAEICETVDSPAALMQVPAYAEALLGSQALWP